MAPCLCRHKPGGGYRAQAREVPYDLKRVKELLSRSKN